VRARGTGSIFKMKGSRFWWIKYYNADGKPIRESGRYEVKGVAVELLKTRFKEMGLGIDPEAGKNLRYEEIKRLLLNHYADQKKHSLKFKVNEETKKEEPYVWGMHHLDEFFAGRRVSSITPDVLQAFVGKRRKKGAEGATINRNLGLLRSMMGLARKRGKLQIIPAFPMQAVNPPRQGYCSPKQFLAIRSRMPENLRSALTFLYYTGARLGEAKRVEWTFDGHQQVDLKKKEITLLGVLTKNGQPRIIPLSDELVGMLKKRFPIEGPVFDFKNFRKEWRKAIVAAKVPHMLLHDFRRSALSNLSDVGVSETDAMLISGHRSRAVFDRYNLRNTARLHEAMQKVTNGQSLGQFKGKKSQKSGKSFV
jgi:integrase